MQEPEATFAANVRRLRIEQKLTQDDLAGAASMDPAEVRRIESGRREPGVGVIVRLADGLGVPVATLFDGIGKVKARRGHGG